MPKKKTIGIVSHTYKTLTVVFSLEKDIINAIYCSNDAPKLSKVIVEYEEKCDKLIGTIIKEGYNISESIDDDELLIFLYNLKECSEIKLNKKDPYIDKRKDLTELFTITIDPKGSKDLDDALSITSDRLYIHIADVTSYLKDPSHILPRANTYYLRSSNVPMLPRSLSDNLISLLPGETKRAITLEFDLEDFELVDYYPSTIINNYQLTYEDVDDILIGHMDAPSIDIPQAVLDLVKCYNRHKKNNRITLNDYQTTSHKMIEEFMVHANCVVAELISNTVYRHHGEPYPNKAGYLQRFIGYQLHAKINLTVEDLGENLNKLPSNQTSTLEHLTKHMMSKAIYTLDKKSHWALNEKYYTHFTSPIRRASDILVHYDLMKRYICNKEDYINSLNEGESVQATIENILHELDFRRNIDNEKYECCVVKVTTKGVDVYIPRLDYTHSFHITECSDGTFLEYKDGELSGGSFKYNLGRMLNVELLDFNQASAKCNIVIIF